jgi:hypothetical protein
MRRMNGNHGNHTAPNGKNNSHLQAGLATGYLCRRTEEELHTIAAATGGIVTARELGSWMGKFLLSQSEADANGLDHRQRVSQVRGGAPERYALPAGPEAVHVRPRHQLSLKGRRAIALAQRQRWAKQKALNAALAKPARKTGTGSRVGDYWAKMSPLQRRREMQRRKMTGPKAKRSPAKGAAALRGYWAAMTPLQRSAEMQRRIKVRDAKRAAEAAA